MNYRNPQLRQALAGEYALGALRGGARARFETLMRHDPGLRRLVVEWQEKLAPLDEETPAVKPPDRVLDALRRRMAISETAAQPRWWNRLAPWRITALANLLLVAVLFGFLGYQSMTPTPQTVLQPLYVGVLSDAREQPTMAILAYAGPWRLVIEGRDPLPEEPGMEVRIWIVDRDSDEPRFLTRVVAGSNEIPLTEDRWAILADAKALIVSHDPVDSSTDAPAGETLYSGVCVNVQAWSD